MNSNVKVLAKTYHKAGQTAEIDGCSLFNARQPLQYERRKSFWNRVWNFPDFGAPTERTKPAI
jgi:hypothetical protein